ncbi:flippase [uncultured Methanomethylovorans sp.]|uniref:flippase n=1 Tax=uncultured Methanomethylovorans sp. TaxID=183759 RepID=UPI002AA6B333|nr:flippase [uncultured Methanomethylovorans sp.]
MKQSLRHGTIYLIAAQVSFVLSGYATHIGLGRFLGPADYGIYAVVISLMTMVNLILSTGIPQAVSKYVAHQDGNELHVKKTAQNMQLIFSLVLFLIYYYFADQLAIMLNDPGLTPYLRLSSLIVPAYALQALYIGYFNGLKEYGKQSLVIILYSVFKVVFILGFAVTSYALYGAITGFIISSVAVLVLGFFFVRSTDKKFYMSSNERSMISARTILDFATPIIFYSVATNLIMSFDLFFVKAYLTDMDVGIYSAVSTISKVPFYIIAGIYGALFPAISSMSVHNDRSQMTMHIIKSVKYSMLVLVPSTLFVVIFSRQVLISLFSEQYSAGSTSLGVLTIAMGFFGLFSLFTTVINGIGQPRVSMFMSLIVLVLDIILNQLFIPTYGVVGAAIATCISCLLGLVISFLYVYRKYNH